MTFTISRDQLDTAIEPGGTSSFVRDALLKWFQRLGDNGYDRDRLHVGSDLSPDACGRKSWYGVHGFDRDPTDLGDEFRFHGGNVNEAAFVEAIRHGGEAVETQVLVQPIRPSAWAWAPGHADALVTRRAHLYEVKAPRARLFDMAKRDATKLVKTSYRWQLSYYFHELRRRGRVRTASFVFIDREGSHQPLEVPLRGELLIPLDKIIEREAELGEILLMPEPPPRLATTLEVKVWKGRPTKAAPKPERRVLAVERRDWHCSYCPFVTTCRPGPEERVLTLAPDDKSRTFAIQAAENSWARGEKKTPVVVRFGPEDEEFDGSEPSAEGDDAALERPF